MVDHVDAMWNARVVVPDAMKIPRKEIDWSQEYPIFSMDDSIHVL